MKNSDTDTSKMREVKSAARTVELLELLAARGNQPARLRELSDALGAPRSSVYALIRTLVDRGWVRADETGTLFSIGIRALLAGTTYLDADPVLRIVQPLINEVSSQLDETIHYARVQGSDIVYLATHESTQYVRPFSRVGRCLPAHATALGKAVLATALAHGGEDAVREYLPDNLVPLTPYTVVDVETLIAQLEETRERGYAIDRQENSVGIICFAFALDFAGPPSDALSCSVPMERLHDGREAEIVDALHRTKHAVERMAPVAATPQNSRRPVPRLL